MDTDGLLLILHFCRNACSYSARIPSYGHANSSTFSTPLPFSPSPPFPSPHHILETKKANPSFPFLLPSKVPEGEALTVLKEQLSIPLIGMLAALTSNDEGVNNQNLIQLTKVSGLRFSELLRSLLLETPR